MKRWRGRWLCVEAWCLIGVFAVTCGAIGARVWDGAERLSFGAMLDEIPRKTNPEFAISECLNWSLQFEAALRNLKAEDSTRGRMAKRALYLLEQGARR